MILNTKSLQSFFQLSSLITGNNIIPIHEYLMLTEDGKMIKTNGRTFISHPVEFSGDDVKLPLLFEEKVLVSFVKLARSKDITVTIKGVDVTLSDGFGKQKFQTVPAKDFPSFPEAENGEEIELEYEALEAIGIAAKNVSAIGGGANFDFVHLVDGWVLGSDRAKLFAKRIDGLPDAILDNLCASIISQFNSVSFYTKGTYDFFRAGNTLYGFQQYGDVKHINVSAFLKEPKDEYFEFEVSDLMYFCDLASSTATIKAIEVLTCRMEGGKLSYIGGEYGKETDVTIPFTGDYVPSMAFNPKFFAPYFKNLGKKKVRLHDFHAGVYVTDPEDKDFVGMISAYAPPTNN